MSVVVRFPKQNTQLDDSASCVLTQKVLEELSYICSDKTTIRGVLTQMKPFINAFNYDFSLDLEINNQNEAFIMEIIPSIQQLQQNIDHMINDLISERILREIEIFHHNQA